MISRKWDRITSELALLGLDSPTDRALLEQYIGIWQTIKEAEKIMAIEGTLVMGKSGSYRMSQAYCVWTGSIAMQNKLLNQLSLTPLARTKIKGKKVADDELRLED